MTASATAAGVWVTLAVMELDHTTTRLSSCEAGAGPQARVITAVPAWSQRKIAVDYLTTLGWERPKPRGWLVSPDGLVEAMVTLVKEPDDARPHIDVTFVLESSR
ncbi:hypothetical protein NOCA2340014 [metagenome]|uniref:Uncharacterized protein n=1 Tax=metagenome TaxID=256318 RepID=A0A2P2C2Z1_9ZZZZ